MIENNTVKVVGKALYLELRKGPHTNQIIITPEGMSASGHYVPTTTYRRRISESAPRKTWRLVVSMFNSNRDEAGKLIQLDKDHALATVADRMSYNYGLFNQLIDSDHKVHGTPFVVDVTPEDLNDVRDGKTPYKVLARITRCRRALGYGEELFATTPATT